MENWRTTIAAIVGAIALLVAHFGLTVTPETQTAIVTLTVVIIGILAKDAGADKNKF